VRFPQGNRPDQVGDRGGEYRNVVGLPGGAANAGLYNALLAAALATGDRLDLSKVWFSSRQTNIICMYIAR